MFHFDFSAFCFFLVQQDRTPVHIICACTTFPTSERQLFKDVLAQFQDATNCLDYLNKNIMHLVCENSGCYIPMIDRVKFIMEQFPNFDLTIADIAGETPLHKACSIDNRDLINYLCEKGGDANARSNVCLCMCKSYIFV